MVIAWYAKQFMALSFLAKAITAGELAVEIPQAY
jgi:hypothetical protein